MAEGRRAVFLDRDGTLLVDRGYMYRTEDLRFLPGVRDSLRRLRDRGLGLVLITNQSGIARGFFTRDEMDAFHRALEARLAASGVMLRGIYVCPHLPEAGCACRKPGTLLYETAVQDLHLNPAASFAVGDRAHDVIAAHRLGIRTVLLRRRYLARELAELAPLGIRPDHVAADFAAAARWILRAR